MAPPASRAAPKLCKSNKRLSFLQHCFRAGLEQLPQAGEEGAAGSVLRRTDAHARPVPQFIGLIEEVDHVEVELELAEAGQCYLAGYPEVELPVGRHGAVVRRRHRAAQAGAEEEVGAEPDLAPEIGSTGGCRDELVVV